MLSFFLCAVPGCSTVVVVAVPFGGKSNHEIDPLDILAVPVHLCSMLLVIFFSSRVRDFFLSFDAFLHTTNEKQESKSISLQSLPPDFTTLYYP